MEPGTLLANQYRIGGLLGQGGMGAVYAGVAVHNGRPVALKVMLADFAASAAFLERLRREAHAMGVIDHPHVVRVFDLVLDAKQPFLAMELLRGRTLGSVLRRDGAAHPVHMARVGVQLLNALEAVHRAGLVHRDVKPDNIFLLAGCPEPFAKLLDFGLVKRVNKKEPELTKVSTALGTWQYMAPEQGLGLHVDARADVYSLGASLYYALTGQRPYEAAGVDAAMFACSMRPTLPLRRLRPDLSRRFCTVIDRALAKEAARRWASAEAMAEALEASIETMLEADDSLSIESVLPNEAMDITARESRRFGYSRDVTTVVRERGGDVGALEMVDPGIADLLEGARDVDGGKCVA
ncbi:serine/threonine protein kinase [Pendulispora brunnea]|uniref:Serine/threonine protein kinase n=1 Tax=Pendulispora brunnea TaxID=2905690 RepID=A0ABZ2K595_9BACT